MSPRHARSLAVLTPFALARLDGPGAYVDGPRKCSSGGAGLLSTARDCSRLLQMILNGGTLEGMCKFRGLVGQANEGLAH